VSALEIREQSAIGVSRVITATRAPFAIRKRQHRERLRNRAAQQVVRAPSHEWGRSDPLHGGQSARPRRVVSAIALSLAVHVGLGLAFTIGRDDSRGPRRPQRVLIEFAPPAPEPTPEPAPSEPLPKAVPSERVPSRRHTGAPPPRLDAAPTPRVVGLSFEATVTAGDGPAFAVGNTREGTTAERATAGESIPHHAEARGPGPAAISGTGDTLPKRRRPVRPSYPALLEQRRIEADVTVRVALGADGSVENVTILKSAAYPEFDAAARRAALREQFEPARRAGRAVPFALTFTYRFRLED
jgi:periplasmic protein TonB